MKRARSRTARAKRAGGGDSEALAQWLEHCEEIQVLFDCALRGCVDENRAFAEQTVLDLMERLDSKGREAGSRVLAHFDSCLCDLERGDFEGAFDVLLELKESWVEALATLRRDRNRAANLN